MHTYGGMTCRIHHNSALTGDVILSVAPKQVESHLDGAIKWADVKINVEDLVNFVAELVRIKEKRRLEEATAQELLGLETD